MEWHRHRVHPLLWQALRDDPSVLAAEEPAQRELAAFFADEERYLLRRPIYSPTKATPPWETERDEHRP
jgi:transposase